MTRSAIPTLTCASLVKPPFTVHVYEQPFGYRIDMITDENESKGRHPDDVGLAGAVTLQRFDANDLDEHVAAVIDAHRDVYQTHVYLREEHRRRGLGIILYAIAFELAILLGVNLVSTDEPSDTARQLWKSKRLNALFAITRIADRFVLLGMKG